MTPGGRAITRNRRTSPGAAPSPSSRKTWARRRRPAEPGLNNAKAARISGRLFIWRSSAPVSARAFLAIEDRAHEIIEQQRADQSKDDDERQRLDPPDHDADEGEQHRNADNAGDQDRYHFDFPF